MPIYLNIFLIKKMICLRLSFQKSVSQRLLIKHLQLIIASGAKPVLIKTIATPKTNSHDCFFNHIKHGRDYKPELCDFRLDRKQGEWFDELFAKMEKKYPQLIIIDPREGAMPKWSLQGRY